MATGGLFIIQLLAVWMVVAGPVMTGTLHAKSSKTVPEGMQERAEAVFMRIAEALSPEHDIAAEYTIEVVAERVPNAWINQDHEIYVSTGLMELLTTDDQLAGVIGHEIAHGTAGHIPHRINHSLWSAFAVIAVGAIASTSGDADWGGLLHMRDLFMYAYSREQESEADFIGMGYARMAGYEAEGLVEALLLMDRERRDLPSDSVWRELYRSHPPISQRVFDLRFALTSERLVREPVQVSVLTPSSTADNARDAAAEFVRALWSGDEAVLEGLTRRGGGSTLEETVGPWQGMFADMFADVIDAGWALSDADIVPAGNGAGGLSVSFDETLIVRLRRWVDGETTETPPIEVTVRRSARGWSVTSWRLVGD